MDVVDEGRRVVDMADHKARYALVVMGALNAGVFLVLSRAHLLAGLPGILRPWLIGVLIAYGGLSCLFVYHAIDCLKPRWLKDSGSPAAAGRDEPGGVLYWETIGKYDLGGYRAAWNSARMDRLNDEVVRIAHHLSLLIGRKYRALARLYRGLAVLLVLATLQLLAFAAIGLAE